MANVLHPAVTRPGVSFELDDFDLDTGRLIVRGLWSGVRGLRFVRPTLVVSGRPVLATLEHKPWAPDADPWVAEFPWSGRRPDIGDVILSVAPSVTVPLDPTAAPPPAPEPPLIDLEEPVHRPEPQEPAPPPARRRGRSGARAAAPPPPDPRVEHLEADVETLRAQTATLAEERDRLRDERDALDRERSELRARLEEAEARAQAYEARVGREREQAGADHEERQREQAATIQAQRERDQALAQRDEAVADRRAALRARQRMETLRDEAFQERDQAVQARDAALGQRDEARSQRSEVLVAHRALERQIAAERADAHRQALERAQQDLERERPAASPAPADEAPAGVRAHRPAALRGDRPTVRIARPLPTPADEHRGAEVPLGVRQIPATRAVAPELRDGPPRAARTLSHFDLWTIRVLGTVAAVCFILLLAMILRAFLL